MDEVEVDGPPPGQDSGQNGPLVQDSGQDSGQKVPPGPDGDKAETNLEKPLKYCPYCEKSFILPSQLVGHLMSHLRRTNNNNPKNKSFNFQCKFCIKSFSRKSLLLIHQKIHEKNSTTSKPDSNEDLITPDFMDETNEINDNDNQNQDENMSKSRKRVSNPEPLEPNSLEFELKKVKIEIDDEAEDSTMANNYCYNEIEDNNDDDSTTANSQLNDYIINLDPIVIMDKLSPTAFKCQLCPKYYPEEELKVHLLSDHKNHKNTKNKSEKGPRKSNQKPKDQQNKKLNNCEFCPKSFARLSELTRHVKVHSQLNFFHCPTCSKSFAKEKNLSVHMKVHQTATVKYFTCLVCQNFYSRKVDLDNHNEMFHSTNNSEKRSKTKPDKKVHTCSICPKSYVSKQNLLLHERSQHPSILLKCNFCDKSFTKNNLDGHTRKLHKNQQLEDSVEQKTSKRPKSQSYKGKNHSSTAESRDDGQGQDPNPNDNLEYKCSFCDESFRKRKRLKKHIDRNHEGEENPFECAQEIPAEFSCSICSEKFLDENALTEHNKTHYEVNYTCKFCEESFKKMKRLQKHIEKAHLDVKSPQNQNIQKNQNKKSKGKSKSSAQKITLASGAKKVKPQLKLKPKPKGDILENLFFCPMCPKKFSGQDALIKHSLKHRDFFI